MELRKSRLRVLVANMIPGCHVRCLMFAQVKQEGSNCLFLLQI
jgi:hypothetical protein